MFHVAVSSNVHYFKCVITVLQFTQHAGSKFQWLIWTVQLCYDVVQVHITLLRTISSVVWSKTWPWLIPIHSVIYDPEPNSNLYALSYEFSAIVKDTRCVNIVLIQLNKPLQNHIQNWYTTLTAISTGRSTTSTPWCLQQFINEGLHFTRPDRAVL